MTLKVSISSVEWRKADFFPLIVDKQFPFLEKSSCNYAFTILFLVIQFRIFSINTQSRLNLAITIIMSPVITVQFHFSQKLYMACSEGILVNMVYNANTSIKKSCLKVFALPQEYV